MKNNKDGIITFKVDEALMEALQAIPNRSEFIRNAIKAAISGPCPLCGGTGTLSPRQKEHWDKFTADHPLKECEECHEWHPVCQRSHA